MTPLSPRPFRSGAEPARESLQLKLYRKALRRLRNPQMLLDDYRNLRLRIANIPSRIATRYLDLYTFYHQKLRTPGGVYTIRGRGYKMWLPISWGKTIVQRRFGIYERETYGVLAAILRPGMIVIELGACYGEFTIYMARLVGANGIVYSFEPFPLYFSILQRNVALNRLNNVVLLNKAVAGSGVERVLFDRESIHPYGSLGQISGLDYSVRSPQVVPGETPTVEVECVSLSDFIKVRKLPVDFIMMDIEGCETEVLKDIEPILRADGHKPILYCELHPTFYRPGDMRWIEALFESCGYATEWHYGYHLLGWASQTRPAGIHRSPA